MTAETYDALSDMERYDLLHKLWDRIIDIAGSEWTPGPAGVAHCWFRILPEAMQKAGLEV